MKESVFACIRDILVTSRLAFPQNRNIKYRGLVTWIFHEKYEVFECYTEAWNKQKEEKKIYNAFYLQQEEKKADLGGKNIGNF